MSLYQSKINNKLTPIMILDENTLITDIYETNIHAGIAIQNYSLLKPTNKNIQNLQIDNFNKNSITPTHILYINNLMQLKRLQHVINRLIANFPNKI